MRYQVIAAAILFASVVVWATGQMTDPAGGAAPTQAWEYKVVSHIELASLDEAPSFAELSSAQARKQRESAALENLNKLGAQGWELIVFNDEVSIFKRLGRATTP